MTNKYVALVEETNIETYERISRDIVPFECESLEFAGEWADNMCEDYAAGKHLDIFGDGFLRCNEDHVLTIGVMSVENWCDQLYLLNKLRQDGEDDMTYTDSESLAEAMKGWKELEQGETK